MLKRSLLLLLLFALVCANPLEGQAGNPLPVPKPGVIPRRDTMLVPHKNAGAYRLASSITGVLGGTLVGALAGYRLLPHSCNCDDPGLDEMVYGAFVVGAAGAALGAAMPDLRSVCDFRTRFTRSLIGSALGAAGAFIVGGGLNKDETVLLLVPASSVAGSLGALGRCWKSVL